MSWFRSKEKHVTLDEIGYPDLWVDFKDINAMSYKQARDLQKKVDSVREAMEAAQEGEGTDGISEVSIMFGEFITNWNIPPMDGNIGDAALDLPSVSPSVMEELPIEVLNFLTKHIQSEEANPVPNPNGS